MVYRGKPSKACLQCRKRKLRVSPEWLIKSPFLQCTYSRILSSATSEGTPVVNVSGRHSNAPVTAIRRS